MSSERRFICQRSGFDFPASELIRDWDGLIVHRRFRNTRNSQDFLRSVKETPPPRMVSAEPTDVFVNQVLTALDPLETLRGLDGTPLTSIEVTY